MQSLKYSSCIDQILKIFWASNKESVKPSVCLAMMNMVFSATLRLTIINKVEGMHYFASGCPFTTLMYSQLPWKHISRNTVVVHCLSKLSSRTDLPTSCLCNYY